MKTNSRRRWLTHCTALACGVLGLRTAAAQASGPGPARAGSASAAKGHHTIVVLGDSLSAEYGLTRGSGWVALLQRRLADRKIDAEVVNASISGDTTSGGRSRLPTLLRDRRPTQVVIELGANDALRGLPLAETRGNLTEMVRSAKAAGAKVVLVGMQVPPNYGRQYADEFAALFPAIAKAEGVALVPFLLHGVADVPDSETLFQADRIHPKEAAHPAILENVWPVLATMLK